MVCELIPLSDVGQGGAWLVACPVLGTPQLHYINRLEEIIKMSCNGLHSKLFLTKFCNPFSVQWCSNAMIESPLLPITTLMALICCYWCCARAPHKNAVLLSFALALEFSAEAPLLKKRRLANGKPVRPHLPTRNPALEISQELVCHLGSVSLDRPSLAASATKVRHHLRCVCTSATSRSLCISSSLATRIKEASASEEQKSTR